MERVEYDAETNFNSTEFHIWLKTTNEFHFEKIQSSKNIEKDWCFQLQ